ncbi:hypothetical protein ACH35V_01895 [Actinomadura sp. 1N219]|uniref:hypothetical protein n=1 Tax=Actinomadura sp. 1N219 TaxID=3375152 RepID=UPI0037937BD7
MAISYPIIEQRPLAEARKQGRPGFRRYVRAPEELPALQPHQVYVLQIGDRFEVRRSRRVDDPDVIAASSVSVVDMAHGAAVPVELPVASQDAQTFVVIVTFECTVVDAVRVVQSGCDITASLEKYLREHSEIFELGLKRRLADWKEFRLDVTAQIKAYAQFVPPTVIGVQVALKAVDVVTPRPITELQSTMNADEGEQVRAKRQAGYAQEMEEQKLAFETWMQERRKEFERRMAEQRAVFVRDQLDLDYQSIGNDPVRAALYAHGKDDLSSEQVADKIGEVERQAEEHREKLRLEQRSDSRQAIEQSREDSLRHEFWAREDAVRAEEENRKERAMLQAWEREDRRERDAREHEDRLRALDARLGLLREIAKHGYLDQINIDVENLIGSIQADTGARPLPSGQSQLTVGEQPARDGDDDTSIEDLTEDDDDS